MLGGTSLQSTTYAMTHNLRGGMLSLHTVASVDDEADDKNKQLRGGGTTRLIAQHVCKGHKEEHLCKLMYAFTKGNPDAPKDDLKVQVLDEIDRLDDLEAVLGVLSTLEISTSDMGAMLNLNVDAAYWHGDLNRDCQRMHVAIVTGRKYCCCSSPLYLSFREWCDKLESY